MRAYTTAPIAATTHNRVKTIQYVRFASPLAFGIALILASGAAPAFAAEPPTNIAKRIAHRESETAAARAQYAYTQSVKLNEMRGGSMNAGEYREMREIIFSPSGERSDRLIGNPVNNLKNLIMTDEDFNDIRNVQPFVMTEDQLWNYEVKYKGEERMDNIDCFVVLVRPRQILSGQRLFDGLLWVKQDDFSVIRSEGQAVPQIRTSKQENLFPRFTTIRKLVNTFWFPALTYADDTLHFRSGPIREKLMIRYNDYKRFGSETKITFADPQ